MIQDIIKDRIDRIVSSTHEAISRVQLSHIPIIIPVNKNNVLDSYTFKGTIYKLDKGSSIVFDNCICRNAHNKGMMEDSYINLYDKGYLHPVMIFINGSIIPWSKIKVIIDYHYIYFLIENNYDDIEDINIIIPCSGVDYYENQTREDNGKQLRFNSLGLYDRSSSDIIFEFVYPDLYMEFFNTSTIKSSLEKAKLSINNLITFKDGKISDIRDHGIEVIDDVTFTIDEGYETVLFYYYMDYDNVDHIDKVEDKESAREMARLAEDDKIIKNIVKPLELEYEDYKKGYIDYEGTLKNIINYDKTLLNPLIESSTKNYLYTGAQIISYSKDNIFTIKNPNYKDGSGMLMFVNGELYSLYREIVHYHSTYKIPITDIKVTDSIEFVFFNNVDKYTDYFVEFPPEGIQISTLIDRNSLSVLAPWYPLELNVLWNLNKDDIKGILYINSVIVIYSDYQIQFYSDLGNVIKIYQTIQSKDIINKICYGETNNELYVLKDNHSIESISLKSKNKFKQYLRYKSEEFITTFNYFDPKYNHNEGLYIATDTGKLQKIYIDNIGLGEIVHEEETGSNNIKYIELMEDEGISSIKIFDDSYDKVIGSCDNNYIYFLKDKILHKMNIRNEIEIVAGYVDTFTEHLNSNIIYNSNGNIIVSNANKDIVKMNKPNIYYMEYTKNHLLVYDGSVLSAINIDRLISDKVWYKIPYNLTEDRLLTIDERYRDTNVCLFSNNTFRYYGVKLDEYDVAGVILPREFSYCKEWDQFMVFINGRRLDQNSYCITTMKTTNPFTETSVFMTIPLEYGDVVDVFYLPKKYEDISKFVSVSPTGYITIPKNLLPYGFSENPIMIFLNGRKIDYAITKDINSYQIKIDENIESRHNLTIVKYIYNDEYKEMNKNTSEWDEIMDSLYYKEKNKLMNGKEIIIGNENSYKEYETTLKTPIYEVLYHYYLTDPSKVKDILLYDFISADFEFDPEGVMVPGAFDATLIDKFKPRKPYDPLV